jgi:alkylation response protein AidB-like acyl-CoA dehydrogenase
MIGFSPSEEQEQLRSLARRFAEQVIRPQAAIYDEREETPWPVLERAAKAGLIAYKYPERYGGGGEGSVLTTCLVSEALGWGCPGIANAILGCDGVALPLLHAGTEAQKARYLPLFCAEDKVRLGAFALTEPGAGSDVASLATTAVRDGNSYVLRGQKCFITCGSAAEVYIVFAQLASAGITAFIVEAGTPGLSAGKVERKIGMRASLISEVILDDVRIPIDNRLGREGEGFYIAMKYFEQNRPVVSALAVGLAQAAYEHATQYAKRRIQFGAPIITKQAIGFMLADMAIEIEAARLLVWRAAWRIDEGQPATAASSMAKGYAADMAMRVTTNAVQVLGGYGVIRDEPTEKWMRDAKVLQIVEGTSQIQRMIVSQLLAVS